jgi:hypothetical protein
VSQKNKLVIIYKLFRFALKPMEFEAYFTVIYVAKLNNRIVYHVSPLLSSHGTITELPTLYEPNTSQRYVFLGLNNLECSQNSFFSTYADNL